MLAPENRGVGRLLAILGLLSAGCTEEQLAADAATADIDTAATAAAADGRASLTDFGLADLETKDISLDSGKFLEIDDISLTDPDQANDIPPEGSRDANLCASGTDYSDKGLSHCPASGVFSQLDNPNFPGPDRGQPAKLGGDPTLPEEFSETGDDDYLDWADLDLDKYVRSFIDVDANPADLLVPKSGAKDDIFSPGACVDDSGSSPNKANFGLTGFAANDTYFYLLNARATSNGNEAYHYFATKKAPELTPVDGVEVAGYQCADVWLWEVQEGDVHIELVYDSTADLPSATANVYVWHGATAILDAKGMIAEIDKEYEENGDDLTKNWDPVSDEFAYAAINTRSGGKALADEDGERYFFQGQPLPSGIMVEVALDIEEVFGSVGCGLQRTISGISTSSASVGGTDDLKDFLFPVTVVTGALSASVKLTEVCPDAKAEPPTTGETLELELVVEQKSEEGGPTVDLTASADVIVKLDINCTNDDFDAVDVVVPVEERENGTIQLTFPDLEEAMTCEVTAKVTGVEDTNFATCNTLAKGSAQVLPDVEPVASLDPDCSGNVAYHGKIKTVGVDSPAGDLVSDGSGAPDFSAAWAFTVDGTAVAPSSDLDGSFKAAASGFASVGVSGKLTVSDLRLRDLDGDGELEEGETCPDLDITQTTTALRPLSVELVPTTGDGTCEPDGNANVEYVNFNAVVKGGSGKWDFDWTESDDMDLDADDLTLEDEPEDTCTIIEIEGKDGAPDVDDSTAKNYSKACTFDIGTDYCASGSVSLLVTDQNTECGTGTDSISADRTSSLDVTHPAP